MGQEWRNRDPIEDKFLRDVNPSMHAANMEEVRKEIEQTKEKLNSESAEITTELVETVGLALEVKRKAESVEGRLQDEL